MLVVCHVPAAGLKARYRRSKTNSDVVEVAATAATGCKTRSACHSLCKDHRGALPLALEAECKLAWGQACRKMIGAHRALREPAEAGGKIEGSI